MKFWEDKEMKAQFEYARKLTAHYSKSFYISTLMLPAEKRWATFATYAFCRFADNIVDNPRNRSKEELIAEVDQLARELEIAARTGESEHPILKPFVFVMKKYGMPVRFPLELLEGVKMDLKFERYKTFDQLYLFCYRVAAVVGLMMTHILGYKDQAAFQYAEKLGIAMQLTNILRDIKEDMERGRIYIPLTELQAFGVSERDIETGNFNEQMHKMMQAQVKRAHDYYEEAQPGIRLLRADSQFAIHSAAKIYRGILRHIQAQDYNPFIGRVFVPQHRKIGILIQEVLRSKVLVAQERLGMALTTSLHS